MIEDLHWLGINWSEGPDRSGLYGPYSQSDRRDKYLMAWRRLLESTYLYPCYCSRKDLAQSASAPNDADNEPLYPGICRDRSTDSDQTSPAGVNWRFRVPAGEAVEFTDLNLGPQRYVAGKDFGDFLVWRRDDLPAYQLAVVVDDLLMRISEVVRGADLLKSTARQLLLWRALTSASADFKTAVPAFFHCELLRDEAGVRLAKRHDALSIRHLRDSGMSPQQVLQLAGCV